MADAEDDTPKPRTWTQWAQDNWQWLLPLGLVVLAGLVAAILWYYRAALPLTAAPLTAPPLTAAPTVPMAAAPQTHTIPVAAQMPAAPPMVPMAAQMPAAPPTATAALYPPAPLPTGAATNVPGAAASVHVAGAYRVPTAQFVDYANLTALQQTPGAMYNVVAGIPQVALATGQVYFSAFPPPQR